VARRYDYSPGMGQARLALATAHIELGDHAQAPRLTRRALGMARANRQRLDEARAMVMAGRLALDGEEAQANWRQAMEIFEAVGSVEANALAVVMRGIPV